MRDLSAPKAGVARLFAAIRELALLPAGGGGITQIARSAGLTQATTHRLLQSLAAEGMVEQDASRKFYRLGAAFFALAVRASHPGELRLMCRPALRRLSVSLGENVVLLVHSERHAVCLDRSDGAPVSASASATAPGMAMEVGASIPLGTGAGTLAILAFLAEPEREHVLRARPASLPGADPGDACALRAELDHVRRTGHAQQGGDGPTGPVSVAVPIVDRGGRAVASLGVDTTADRLGSERLSMVLDLLKREAAAIGPGIAPFDALLQRPASAWTDATR